MFRTEPEDDGAFMAHDEGRVSEGDDGSDDLREIHGGPPQVVGTRRGL